MTTGLRLAWLSLLLLLGACATAPTPPAGGEDWAAQQARIAAITHFTASGKIALRSKHAAESASLQWRQAGAVSQLRLSGPIGLGATVVDSDGEQVTIRRGDEVRQWAIDDAALHSLYGVNLPLNALPHWLKGIPAPGLALEQLDLDPAQQRPRSLVQQGWRVEYEAFERFSDYLLPTRIAVSQGDSSARILLRRWEELGSHE